MHCAAHRCRFQDGESIGCVGDLAEVWIVPRKMGFGLLNEITLSEEAQFELVGLSMQTVENVETGGIKAEGGGEGRLGCDGERLGVELQSVAMSEAGGVSKDLKLWNNDTPLAVELFLRDQRSTVRLGSSKDPTATRPNAQHVTSIAHLRKSRFIDMPAATLARECKAKLAKWKYVNFVEDEMPGDVIL
ncbi:hypothetical protein BC829DRAFT_436421 [Chytridium lagenaria]|nr:hypothetical protein BC829DRAFT_436421 [Chytridium lagenaria]